jgi:outer membrane lipoprotein
MLKDVMNILAVPIVGMALFLQGCSYAISSDVTQKADRTLTFEHFQSDPATFKGTVVIYGGVIAQTKNVKNGTLIEVDQKELDYWGKPRRTKRTGGRFIVFQPRHLDVMVYAPGREITVAGEVTGTDEQSLSDAAPYPLLNVLEIKLWPPEKPGWDRPQFLDPLYDRDAPQGKFGY